MGVNVFKVLFFLFVGLVEERVGERPSFVAKVVLDVLKPHVPSLVEFSMELARVPGVSRVDAVLVEVDAETDSIKLTVEGRRIDYGRLEDAVKRLGAAIHSVDEVVVESEG